MVKAELISQVAEATGETEETTQSVLDNIISTITDALGNGEAVDLHPLGRFLAVVEPEHAGTDPSNHEAITIPEHTRVLYHPAQAVRDALNAA